MQTRMKIIDVVNKLFYDWEWLCAYREIKDSNHLPDKNDIFDYQIIDMPKGYWAADPFIYEKDGEVDLFFEFYSIKKRKAALGHKRISDTNEKINIIYEFEGHSSYPCIFEWNEELYIIPETKAEKELVLLRCIEYPHKWIKESVLLKDVDFVDSTPFKINGKNEIFLYSEVNEGNVDSILYIGELDVNSGSVHNITELMKYNSSIGRPAGHVLYQDQNIIRVTQPGINHYGEKIEFKRIVMDKKIKYQEIKVGELSPKQIRIDRKEIIKGIHTFNRSEHYEVIDILTKGHFSLFRPIRFVLQKLGILGYGDYDCERQYAFIEKNRNF